MTISQNRLPRNGAPVAALLQPPVVRRVTNCEYNPQFERVELLDDQNQVRKAGAGESPTIRSLRFTR